MIEREQWNEYYYTNNYIYCRDCWEYNNIEELDMENKQNTSYEIEEIVNDFLNN